MVFKSVLYISEVKGVVLAELLVIARDCDNNLARHLSWWGIRHQRKFFDLRRDHMTLAISHSEVADIGLVEASSSNLCLGSSAEGSKGWGYRFYGWLIVVAELRIGLRNEISVKSHGYVVPHIPILAVEGR